MHFRKVIVCSSSLVGCLSQLLSTDNTHFSMETFIILGKIWKKRRFCQVLFRYWQVLFWLGLFPGIQGMYVSKRDRVQVVQAFSGCLTKGQFENRGSSSLLPCPLKYPLACIIICYIPDLTSKIGNFHVLGQVCSIKCYMLRGIICAWRKNRNEFRSPWSSWRNNDFPAAMAMLPYSECAFIWWSVAEESLLGNESGRTGK